MRRQGEDLVRWAPVLAMFLAAIAAALQNEGAPGAVVVGIIVIAIIVGLVALVVGVQRIRRR